MRISLRWKMASSCSILSILVVGLSAYLVLLECDLYRRVSHTTASLLILGMAAAIAGGTIAWLVDRRIKQTLTRMIEAARRMARGELDQRIRVDTGDEFEELAEALNQIAEGLKHCQINLEALHQEQLMRADRLVSLGEMACRIAHEIRNPVACISGAIQVLSENPSYDYPEELFEKIQQQVDRVDRVVKDFLRYSNLPPLELKLIDLNEVIESALFWVLLGCKESKVRLDKDFAPSLPQVMGDPNQLEQAFLNIFLNALQAMPGGGDLQVKTWLTVDEEGSKIVLRIKDTGVGMKLEVLNNIFLPFFTTKHHGTGLGLAIVQQILTRHQAFIVVDSEPHKGTSFTLTFLCLDSRIREGEGEPCGSSRSLLQINGGRPEQGLLHRERRGPPDAVYPNHPDRR